MVGLYTTSKMCHSAESPISLSISVNTPIFFPHLPIFQQRSIEQSLLKDFQFLRFLPSLMCHGYYRLSVALPIYFFLATIQ